MELCCLYVLYLPIFMEDNKESCSDGGDHDEDLGDVQCPLPVRDVVQGEVGEGGQLRSPQLVGDGQGHGGQQEVAEDEAKRREGLPVLLGELCGDDPLRRHPDLNLDRGSIPDETIFNILTKVLKVKRPTRYLMRGLLS